MTTLTNPDEIIHIKSSTYTPLHIELETARLFIRPYKDENFQNSLELYGDSKITQYFNYGTPLTTDEVKELILKSSDFFKQGQPFGLFSIFGKQDMNFIGHIDLLPTTVPGTLELGFILHSKYQNQGFCTEVVKFFVSDYINELKKQGYTINGHAISEIIATVHPENIPSKKVLEKIGMRFKKIQKRFKSIRLFYSLNI